MWCIQADQVSCRAHHFEFTLCLYRFLGIQKFAQILIKIMHTLKNLWQLKCHIRPNLLDSITNILNFTVSSDFKQCPEAEFCCLKESFPKHRSWTSECCWPQLRLGNKWRRCQKETEAMLWQAELDNDHYDFSSPRLVNCNIKSNKK